MVMKEYFVSYYSRKGGSNGIPQKGYASLSWAIKVGCRILKEQKEGHVVIDSDQTANKIEIEYKPQGFTAYKTEWVFEIVKGIPQWVKKETKWNLDKNGKRM